MSSTPLNEILPDRLTGWNAEKSVVINELSDLYDYIDGGAELYLSYGFSKALSRTYKNGDQEVIAEIYDLVEPRNAFGVFTQTREDEGRRYGQGTYTIPGALFFWKDHYYISLSAWAPGSQSDAFINDLAAYIDARITEEGILPDLLALLPQEKLIPFGFRYFHHYVWINSFFFISDENILNIDKNTDALIAKYEDSDKRKYLLIIEYSDSATALEAYNKFRKEFYPEGLTGFFICREDDTWVASVQTEKLVFAVFNASSREQAGELLEQVIIRSKTYNH